MSAGAHADDDPSTLVRIGATVGAGVLASLIATLPAALRVSGGQLGGALGVWHVLVALGLAPALLATYVAMRSRVGARHVVSGRVVELATVGFASFGVLALLLGVLGSALRSKTHHRGLGGTTFALVALFLVVLVVAIVARAVAGLASKRLALRLLLIGSALFALFAMAVLARQLTTPPGHPWARALMDGMALMVAAGLASGSGLAGPRVLAIIGVPAAVVLLAIGFASLRAEPHLTRLLAEQAPAHGWVAARLFPPTGG